MSSNIPIAVKNVEENLKIIEDLNNKLINKGIKIIYSREKSVQIIEIIDSRNNGNNEIGNMQFIIMSDSLENTNMTDENTNMTDVNTNMTDVNKNGNEIYIKWLSVEENYKKKGYSNLLLYIFFKLLENNAINPYITLEDYSDNYKNLKRSNIQKMIKQKKNNKKPYKHIEQLLNLFEENMTMTIPINSRTRSGTKFSPVNKLQSTTFWKRLGAVHTSNDGEAFISSENVKILKKNIEIRVENNFPEFNKIGGKFEYIMTMKGKRKIYIGARGGKYYIINKKKIYIKKI